VLRSARRQHGASLTEVMIAVTLVGIMLAMGLPSFQGAMQNRQIRTAADAIQNGLQTARTEALRRNRVVRFSLLNENSWRVGCDPVDDTVVAGEQVCPETVQSREGSEGSRNALVEPVQTLATDGSAASTVFFTGDLRFTPLGRVAADGQPASLPAGNLAIYRITNPGGGNCTSAGGGMKCLSVVVTAGGQIRMCDPAAVTPGDPRAC
jgi:type IV fimbrial biogenesis protein FimT